MKPKSLFVSSLIAAAAMGVSAFADGDQNTILINFRTSQGTGATGVTGTWNEIANDSVGGIASGTVDKLVFSDGSDSTASLSYSANNVWGAGRYADGVLKGYLDDGGSGASISLLTSFLVADVTIYCGTDNGNQFTAKTVNGIAYTYDSKTNKTIAGSSNWGSCSTTTAVEGQTALTISGVSAGNISIFSSGGGTNRGCIAGLKIVNAYSGTRTDAALSGTEATWTNTTLVGSSWTNSTASAGTYAAFNLSAATTVNISESGVATDAIIAAGTGALTLTGNELSLIGPGIIRTDSTDVSIVVNNTLNFANGGTISGNVSFGDSGKLNVTGGVLSVDAKAPTQGNNSVTVAEGAEVKFSKQLDAGTYSLDGVVSGAGTIGLAMAGNNGTELNVGNFAGKVRVVSGLLNLSASTLNNIDILADGGAGLVFAETKEISNKVVLDGNVDVHANLGKTGTLSGEVSGSTLLKKGSGTLNLTGTVKLDTIEANQGALTLSGASQVTNIYTRKDGTLNALAADIKTTEFRQDGGTANIGDGTNAASVTTVNYTGTANGSNAGTLNIKDKAVLTVTGEKTGINGFEHAFQLAHWGATQTVNVEGVLNLSKVSLGIADGNAAISVKSTGEANFNAGLSLMARNGSGVSVNLDGGRINIGKGGISNDAKLTLNLNSGTIGSLTDSWSSERNLELKGAISIDTAVQTYTEGAKAIATTTGSTITLSGVLSGEGSLTKIGEGKLVLSGANTYAGDTTISAGTLVAGNTSALGSGKVVLDGGHLEVSDGTILSNVAYEIVLGEAYKEVAAISGSLVANAKVSVSLGEDASLESYKLYEGTNAEALKDAVTLGSGLENWLLTVSGNTLTLSSAIPEPSLFGLLAGMGALALVATRRRRK